MPSINVSPITDSFGAVLTGVDAKDLLDEAAFAGVEAALYNYGLIALKNQEMDHGTQIEVTRRFGETAIHAQTQYTVPEAQEIYIFGNTLQGSNPAGGRFWHSDQSYQTIPSGLGLMYAVEVPEEGGDTLFADMYAAYETLDADTKERIDGLTARHLWHKVKSPERIAELDEEQPKKLAGATHPVVRVHPKSGRKALFVSAGFTTHIEGMDEDESNELLDRLFAHQARDEFQYSHRWEVGDFVIWDHRCLIHAATYYNPEQRRTLYRTSVEGEPCVSVAEWAEKA
ncbi:MAG TPA: taurine dioxygenase, partial [Rhodospirillaceae bacterium]|nr:taurine dioxygenase [Rhodospirillaceae bacterium]